MAHGWRPARVRCLEGGRTKQTPAFIQTQNGWLPLRLISESLRAGAASGSDRERRFVVEEPGGGRLELRLAKGVWLARKPQAATASKNQLD